MGQANFETGFSLHRLQGLKPGASKLWVNWIQNLHSPAVVEEKVSVASFAVRYEHLLSRGDVANSAHRDVVVHVACESKGLKPVSHLIGARAETRRLSAMGQGESTCTAPPRISRPHYPPGPTRTATRTATRLPGCRGVALQVAFERQTLKPTFSLDKL
jgi:hypothetical protein